MELSRKVWSKLLGYQFFLLILIFGAAGTLWYWQGWLTWGLCFACFAYLTRVVLRESPDLAARRMEVGPIAEKRPAQKVVQSITSIASVAVFVVPGLDHRLGWSHVPVVIVAVGAAGIVAGCWIILLVFRANRFAAATIRVEEGQSVVRTGPYSTVRHPMYSGAVILFFGVPLAMGSYWGLLVGAAILVCLVARILDEELALSAELSGYDDYRREVRSRLIPGVW